MAGIRKIATRQDTVQGFTGRFSDGSDWQAIQLTTFIVDVIDAAGQRTQLQFDHNPTDDELVAALPPPQPIRPSALADRVEAVAELAIAYNALRTAAGDTTAFAAQERTRLNAAADLVAQRIKALV